MKIRYTLRAANELEAGVDWYEERCPGLGIAFLDRVEAAFATMLSNPWSYPRTHGPFRRCLVKRFPFSIHYTIEDEVLVVHSIFDNRRNPKDTP